MTATEFHTEVQNIFTFTEEENQAWWKGLGQEMQTWAAEQASQAGNWLMLGLRFPALVERSATAPEQHQLLTLVLASGLRLHHIYPLNRPDPPRVRPVLLKAKNGHFSPKGGTAYRS